MFRNTLAFAIVPLLCASAACVSQQSKLREAHVAAIEERADEHVEAAEANHAAQREAIMRNAERQVEYASKYLEGEDEELAAANIERQEGEQLYQSKARTRLEKLAIRVHEVQEKLSLEPEHDVRVDATIRRAHQQVGSLDQEIDGLLLLPSNDWNRASARIDHRLDELDAVVTGIRSTVD